MSEEVSKKKKIRSRKVRKQRILVGLLSLMVISVMIIQIKTIVEARSEEDYTVYTSLNFDVPLGQTLKILSIENNGNARLFNNQNKVIEYSDIKNYDENNLSRYEAYHELHPELLESEIIWRVNVNFDYVPYTNVYTLQNPLNILTVVNKTQALSSSFVPNDLELIEGINDEFYLRSEANEMFSELVAEIKAAELSIGVDMAYANYNSLHSEYINLVNEGLELQSFKAGHNEHQLGLAVNVFDPSNDTAHFEETDLYHYLTLNAHRFGFIFRYPNVDKISSYPKEISHLRYVGKDVAVDMYEKNIGILEEYLDKHGDR